MSERSRAKPPHLLKLSKNKALALVSIFEPDVEMIKSLGDAQSEKLFRELVTLQAEKAGIPTSAIHCSSEPNLSDGGIDISVSSTTVLNKSWLPKGKTGFQIKSGNSFKPWTEASAKKELFGGNAPNRKNLKSGIRQCLREGKYIVVTFGHELDDKRHEKAMSIWCKHLRDAGIQRPKIEIWGANNIAGILKSYPALILQTKGIEEAGLYYHKTWRDRKTMHGALVKTDDYDEKQEQIRNALRSKESAKHMRVIGEPGIGKTRFVLEATDQPDIRSRVVYAEADSSGLSQLVSYIINNDTVQAILVVDECDSKKQRRLWEDLAGKGSRVKLITIYNEMSERDDGLGVDYPRIPRLTDNEIEKILHDSYSIVSDRARNAAVQAGGNPRFAHLIGHNLQHTDRDISESVDGAYDIVLGGNLPDTNPTVKNRRKIIRFLSLFQKFGYKGEFESDARSIHELIKIVCPDLTWQQFKETIKWFVDQNILQGNGTLYISVPILQIAMWKEWWSEYSSDVSLGHIFEKIPPNTELRGWFYARFRYAATSVEAMDIAKYLLGPRGPFQKQGILEIPGGDQLFLALSDSMPKEALGCLETTVGKKSKNDLLRFIIGRREAVNALEKIAVHEEFFPRSAKLLLRLAEAENESWVNNATGVFEGLFSLGSGKLAPTATPPKKRLAVLQFAIKSKNKEWQKLAIKAAGVALQTGSFWRVGGAEYQGVNEIPLWEPKSRHELITAYADVLDILAGSASKLGAEAQAMIINAIAENSRGLIAIPELGKKTITILGGFPRTDTNQELVLGVINGIIEFEDDTLSRSQIRELKSIEEKIVGTSYRSKMKRYVAFDPYIDVFGSRNKHAEIKEREIKKLANLSLQKNRLQNELKWLVTKKAKNVRQFGYEFSKADKNRKFLAMILDAQKESNPDADTAFLGGYLRQIFCRDTKTWEKIVGELAKDVKLQPLLVELIAGSGLSDSVGKTILRLAEKSILSTHDFSYFQFSIKDLSESVFLEWVDFLLKRGDERTALALLGLFYMYFISGPQKTLPVDTTLAVLTDSRLTRQSAEISLGPMVEFNWSEIAKVFIKQNDSKALELADAVLSNFAGHVFGRYNAVAQEVLNEIAKARPDDMWEIVSRNIALPMDTKTRNIRRWLRISEFLTNVSFEKIKKWIKQDEKNRAWFMAYSIPPILEGTKNNLIRRLLISFGKRDDVKRNIVANLYTETIKGNASTHYRNKIEKLEEWKKKETHNTVLQWIDWYISSLENSIEKELGMEEREF